MNNLQLMKNRLNFLGGNTEGRMIKGKAKTLDKALYASYQGADAILVPKGYKQNESAEIESFRCLINPNLNKQDYDEKIISAHYEHSLENGSIIKWIGTSSYWLVYLQQLTEDAYFRAAIRRARYTINFKDDDGKIVSVYAAVRGPVETKINFLEKGNFRTDTPNWSLELLMPANEIVLKNIYRYSKFMLEGTMWQVQVVDSISTPGIVQVAAVEYYVNKDVDDVENELAFGLIPEKEDPNSAMEDYYIEGKTFIKVMEEATYSIVGLLNGKWSYDDKIICVNYHDDNKITIEPKIKTSGQTMLTYTDNDGTVAEKVIVIESLF